MILLKVGACTPISEIKISHICVMECVNVLILLASNHKRYGSGRFRSSYPNNENITIQEKDP